MGDTLTREDIEAIRNFAAEPCECPDGARLIADEAPNVLCMPCRAKRWVREGVRLAKELS